MRTALFAVITLLRTLIIIGGVVGVVVNGVRAASGKDRDGYVKAIKLFAFITITALLLTLVEFVISYSCSN